MAGGSEAGKSGVSWETWVRLVAQNNGFSVLNYKLREKHNVPVENRRVIWTNYPYRTIFKNLKVPRAAGSKSITEFVVECEGKTARIECKWQSAAGSVDEKYPFMYLNGVLTMEEDIVVFAMGGEYFERGKGREVRDWLEDSCANPPSWLAPAVHENLKKKKLLVLTPNTFEKWFRTTFGK